MYKKFSSLVEYVGLLIKKHNELQQYQKPIFKLIKISCNKQGEDILYVQVANKASVFQCRPIEIISYNDLLEGFSKKDIRTITYLATKYECKPKTKIISYRFCDKLKRFFLKIKGNSDEKTAELTASELSTKKPLLSYLNQEDAYRVGYLAAIEQFDLENEFIKKDKFG